MATSIPETHLTRHEDWLYSVIHQGQPLTRPQALDLCKRHLRKAFPKMQTVPCWDAVKGVFTDPYDLY